jgi:tetratricopeptide (TPR) repeat protein
VSQPLHQPPLIDLLYETYLCDDDISAFTQAVSERYTSGTLERISQIGSRMSRRGAILSLAHLGGYDSNASMGRALNDPDRGVRLLAESGIREIWCRAGDEQQRRQLRLIMRLNASQRYAEAINLASALVTQAPWFAEVWNQRAIAHFRSDGFADSIRDCHQALEINPYHFGAAAGMGQCHLEQDDAMSALDCFRRALKLNPNMEGVRAQVIHLERTLEGK